MLRKLDVMKHKQEEKKSKPQSINQPKTPPAPSLNQPKQQSPKKPKKQYLNPTQP
jgi:hypothetical protein